MLSNISIPVSETIGTVSGVLLYPKDAKYLMILAHGAGAGMHHLFMEQLSNELAKQQIATLRYQFPYMEKGKKRPDSPKIAHQTIRAALEKAKDLADGLPLLAAGKSFGGRMTSQLAAAELLSEIKGIIYFGFPLHAPGRNTIDRAAHLVDISIPMLFLQGTRDTLALPNLMQQVCDPLETATLQFFEGADHSFKMLKRSGISQEEVIERLAISSRKWAEKL